MLTLNILIIDDHKLMAQAYENVLQNFENYDLNINKVYNCEQAFNKLSDVKYSSKLDIVLLDLILPEYIEQNLHSGTDIALMVKNYAPDCKIIFLTSHSETFILYKIIKEIDPIGLLVKSEFTGEELLAIIQKIVNGEKYYSPIIKHFIDQLLSNDKYLDNYDRQIISLLAQGITTKNLPNYIPLSISAIQKRKAHIKEYFDVCNGNDEDLIQEARRRNFI